MEASPGGAEAAEIFDMDGEEGDDSSSTCTEEDNEHVIKLNAGTNHARMLVGSVRGSVMPDLVSLH